MLPSRSTIHSHFLLLPYSASPSDLVSHFALVWHVALVHDLFFTVFICASAKKDDREIERAEEQLESKVLCVHSMFLNIASLSNGMLSTLACMRKR